MAKNIVMVAYTNYLTDARPRREAESLVSRGDKVYFVALAEKNRPNNENVRGVNIFRVGIERYRGDSGIKYIFQYFKFFILASILTLRLYRKYSVDLIYIHTMPDFMVFVGMLPKLWGAKIILNVHDMMPELYMSKFGSDKKTLLIRLVTFQERLSCSFADKIICVHHPHREVLVNRGVPIEKITVLMNVPDPMLFPKPLTNHVNQDKFRMIYHGTIAHRLGLDLAIDAFAIILKDHPMAIFEIYGDGDSAADVENKIQDLQVGNNVIFHRGFFRIEDIPQIVRGASLGIIPNRKDTATEYMLPVKLLEYIHLGVPVAAPRLLTIQYYFNDDCLAFYEAGNTNNLAEVILKLMNNITIGENYTISARKILDEYTWDKMKYDLFNVIDQ